MINNKLKKGLPQFASFCHSDLPVGLPVGFAEGLAEGFAEGKCNAQNPVFILS